MSRCTKKNCPMQYGTVSHDCDIKDCSWRTEDAVWVKVVRCKECVHNGEYTDCPLNGYAKTDDSYCSYGERRGRVMAYTEEMTTSEILLRLASMRNELLQAVNDIEKISKNICYKAEQTEQNSSEKPNNCEKDCFLCKWLGDVDVCGRCRNRNLFCEAEPQPRCPKCGKRGYIRSLESMGVKLNVYDEYKWKCTNCNKYFKEKPKDESQTERSE